MRSAVQLKAISSQLELLENLKCQLNSLQDFIENVMTKGQLWIEEKDDMSYLQINQVLSHQLNKISESLMKCFNTFNGKEEISQEKIQEMEYNDTSKFSFLKDGEDYQLLAAKVDNMEKSISKHSKQFKLVKKYKSKIKMETASKFQEIMRELHSASAYIQSQEERLNTRINDVETLNTKIVKDLETSLYDQFNANKSDLKNVEISTKIIGHIMLNFKKYILDKIKRNEEEIQLLALKNEDFEKYIRFELKKINDILRNDELTFLRAKSSVSKLKIEGRDLNDQSISTGVDDLKNEVINFSTMAISTSVNEEKLQELTKEIQLLHTKTSAINTEIHDISEKLGTCLRRIHILDSKDGSVAFHTQLKNWNEMDIKANEILTCFKKIWITCKDFNESTGIFNVPCSGLYLCSLSLDSMNDEQYTVDIYVRKHDNNEVRKDFLTKGLKFTISVKVFPIELNKEEKMYLKLGNPCSKVHLNYNSFFSCVLIHKY